MASYHIAEGYIQPEEEDSRPQYFDGKHYRHWKARMSVYVQSVDLQSWLIIQNGPLPIPGDQEGKEHDDEASYTREQMDVLQTNARAKHILYCALSMEEFKNTYRCKTAKEMWEKLEIIHRK